MAFAAAFSPMPPPPGGVVCRGDESLPTARLSPFSPPLSWRQLPHSSPCSPVPLQTLEPAGEPPHFDLEPAALDGAAATTAAAEALQGTAEEEAESTPCQFAPLLQLRRAQAMEAPAAATGAAAQSHASACSAALTADDRVHDALDAMDVLLEAATSARALGRRLSGVGNEALPLLPPAVPATGSDAPGCKARPWPVTTSSEDAPALHPVGLPCSPQGGRRSCSSCGTSRSPSPRSAALTTVPALSAASAVAFSVAEAAVSVAEAFLTATGPAEPAHTASCVEGLLRVEGDLAMDTVLLRETLHVVLLRLLEPLALVDRLALVPRQEGVDGGSRGGRGAGTRRDACAFAFEVCVADPHDVEPLRETLLLEAESGGARRLLPLLAEQLCDDGLPAPRHLKVRLEVRGVR